MAKRGSKGKSELFHKVKRNESLIAHLERQLSSGRYSGDQQTAVDWLVDRKMELALLEHQLEREAWLPGTRRLKGVKLHPMEKNPALPASDATRLPYLRLAAAATNKAIADCKGEDDLSAVSAVVWLCVDALPRLALELMGFESEPAELFTRGLPDVIKARPTGRKLGKTYS
jgi:hypothetical protein